jgi:hypothetical protein
MAPGGPPVARKKKATPKLARTPAKRVEAEWLRGAQRARRLAGKRGIDQGTIDRAIEEVRYRDPRNRNR